MENKKQELPKEFIANLAFFSSEYVCSIRTALAKNAYSIYEDKTIVEMLDMLKGYYDDFMSDVYMDFEYSIENFIKEVSKGISESIYRSFKDVLYTLLKKYWND